MVEKGIKKENQIKNPLDDKTMIILFANQKGGVGKSTLALTFSIHLSKTYSRSLSIIDLDFQKSIFNKYQNDNVLENKPLFKVFSSSISDSKALIKELKRKEEEFFIIDIPGRMNDDNLIPLFSEADLVITPFSYDEYSVHSTINFSFVLRKLNKTCKLFLVPNRVKKTVRYETLESVNNALSNFGIVTDQVHERIDFQRLTIFEIPENVKNEVVPIFELIQNNIDTLWVTNT